MFTETFLTEDVGERTAQRHELLPWRVADLARRVRRGARVLTAADPEWFMIIDLSRLDMGDIHRCVLGQWGIRRRGRAVGLPWRMHAAAQVTIGLHIIDDDVCLGFSIGRFESRPRVWECLGDLWHVHIAQHRGDHGSLPGWLVRSVPSSELTLLMEVTL